MTIMPSDISGSVSDTLSGKRIVVGVNQAASPQCESWTSFATSSGEEQRFHCTMSLAAQQILHPYALEYASTQSCDHGDNRPGGTCGVFAEWTAGLTCFLIAPATANTIGKMACGI